jgi:glycosyltransferase involved in cell wall biosynthesis
MNIVKAENSRKDVPLVSVIAVCYNHAKYVEEALSSVLSQTYRNIELIIIDACSQDNSVSVIESWIKNNGVDCTFERRKSPHNISQNLNFGIKASHGEFIQILATDDILKKNKLRDQIEVLQNEPQYSAIFSNAEIIDENSVLTGATYQAPEKLSVAFENDSFGELVTRGCFVIPHSMLIRQEVYSRIGLYDESLVIEDWDFYLRFFKSGEKMLYQKDPLVFYRKVSSSAWSNKTFSLFKSQVAIFIKHDLFEMPPTIFKYLIFFKDMNRKDFGAALKLLWKVQQTKWIVPFIALRMGVKKGYAYKMVQKLSLIFPA